MPHGHAGAGDHDEPAAPGGEARAHSDYQVNLKAELEIRQLHEKLDHILMHQWERLAEIQQVQLDVLSELGTANRGGHGRDSKSRPS